jgi:hypothetical protein
VQATVTYTVARRTTSTVVSCTPPSVTHGQTTDYTATVTDTSAVGTPVVPTGRVGFSATGAGSFHHVTCTLAPLSASSAQCSDSYIPTATGAQTITAEYHQDTVHQGSSGSTGITVG